MGLSEYQQAIVLAAYDRYADMLYRMALSYLQSGEDARDAVHDVYTKYMRHLPSFSDSEQERAWFIRVTINECHDLLRKKKMRDYVPVEELAELAADSTDSDREAWMDLMRELAKLPDKLRAVMILHYLEDFSVEEIAVALKLSQSAVKMRLKRGRELLQKGGAYV